MRGANRSIMCVLVAASVAFGCGESGEREALSNQTSAITYGTLDGDAHPNVGALILLHLDGKWRPSCSGVLIGPKAFLTAGHCVAWFVGKPGIYGKYGVSFLSRAELDTPPRFGTAVLHPGYVHYGGEAVFNDFAVIVLDEPPGLTPATLPELGMLDTLAEKNGLRDQLFTTVGYGATESGGGGRYRRWATEGFFALAPHDLMLSQNPALGYGGDCWGDSGAPNFLGDSALVVSTASGGDMACRSLNTTPRLDTAAALDFLADYVD